jgi:ribosomal protein S18 acetylase RimI-like enzyme
MELRTANEQDLPALNTMFKATVEDMQRKGIILWNDYYPFEEFPSDIETQKLYVITHGDELVAAFCLYDAANGQDCFEWKDKNAKAIYLFRVGVNVDFQRQGIGALVLKNASEIAKRSNAKFLRLLVSDTNTTALAFYCKNGFTQVAGVYNEFSEALNINIVELGFEMELP